MPKVRGLTQEQRLSNQEGLLADRCDVLLYEKKVSKSKVAEYVGKTPQAIGKQFRSKRLSVDVLIAIVTLTKIEPERLKDFLTVS